MRIKSLSIKNFKCLGPDKITVDFSENIIVLIGENNVGKSAVLKALKFFFDNTKKMPKEYFFNHRISEEDAIEIILTFDELTDNDKEHRSISGHILTENLLETWTLKKKYFYSEDDESVCQYFAVVGDTETENPGGRQTNTDDLFYDDKMQLVFVEAVKNISDEIKTGGRGSSTFQQVFNLLIENVLHTKPEYEALLSALEDYKNLLGGSSKITEITELEQNISKRLSRIISSKSLIKTLPPIDGDLLPVPKLTINDGREVDVEPEHQGHGLQRTIIFSLLELLAESKSPADKKIGPKNLILIEEPEIYMHPQMERKIADTLYEIASSGKAQVICTTHSPIFIRIAEIHKALVRLIRKNDNSSKVTQKDEIFSGEDKENKRKKLRMITNFDPAVNELFFAKRIVLVEGDTEIAVFREAAELLNYFDSEDNKHKKRDTTFVNCRGKWTIPLFQEVMNHFGIDYVVIHDKDGEELNAGANGKILELLNQDESKRKLFDTKIEAILDITDNGKDKPIKALERIQELNIENRLENQIGEFIKFAYNIT